jgi:hypothetical protein
MQEIAHPRAGRAVVLCGCSALNQFRGLREQRTGAILSATEDKPMSSAWRGLPRVLPVLIVLACVFVLGVSRFSAPRTVKLRWDYDYSHDPYCSSRWAENCTLGFYVFVGSPAKRFHQVFIENQFDAGHQVLSRGIEAEIKVREFGYLQFCVAAVKQGSMGATVESTPLCSRQLVLPNRFGRHLR